MALEDIAKHDSWSLQAIRTASGTRIVTEVDGTLHTIELSTREGYRLASVLLSPNDSVLVQRLAQAWVGPDGEVREEVKDGIRAVLLALDGDR